MQELQPCKNYHQYNIHVQCVSNQILILYCSHMLIKIVFSQQCGQICAFVQNFKHHKYLHMSPLYTICISGKSRDCRHCGKYFASMKYLKRHERLHESVRHTCEHCATSFSQAPDLKKHIRRTHPTAFHPCAFCPQYFSGK